MQKPDNTDLSKMEIFQLVTEVSSRVADDIRRDGYVRAVLNSRAKMPNFTKKVIFYFETG